MGLENSFKRAYDELISSFIELENDLTTNFNDELLLNLYFEELKKVAKYKAKTDDVYCLPSSVFA